MGQAQRLCRSAAHGRKRGQDRSARAGGPCCMQQGTGGEQRHGIVRSTAGANATSRREERAGEQSGRGFSRKRFGSFSVELLVHADGVDDTALVERGRVLSGGVRGGSRGWLGSLVEKMILGRISINPEGQGGNEHEGVW